MTTQVHFIFVRRTKADRRQLGTSHILGLVSPTYHRVAESQATPPLPREESESLVGPKASVWLLLSIFQEDSKGMTTSLSS